MRLSSHPMEFIIPHEAWIRLTDDQQKALDRFYPSIQRNYKDILFVAVSKPSGAHSKGVLYLEATSNTRGRIFPPRYSITISPNGDLSQSRID